MQKAIDVPNVTKKPSTFDGAQYNFVDLLKEKAEMEVSYVNA